LVGRAMRARFRPQTSAGRQQQGGQGSGARDGCGSGHRAAHRRRSRTQGASNPHCTACQLLFAKPGKSPTFIATAILMSHIGFTDAI
jgi:hypothetical protein